MRSGDIQRLVECNDAAKGRDRTGRTRPLTGFQRGIPESHAARLGLLDDPAGGRLAECLDAFQRGIGIGNIVVAQFLARQYACIGNTARRGVPLDVQRAVLVGVFAISENCFALE